MRPTRGAARSEPATCRAIEIQSHTVHGGKHAVCVDLGDASAQRDRFFQCFASGFGPTKSHHQTRNLARWQRLEFWAKNDTGAALPGFVEIKDYQDSDLHRAMYRFELPPTEAWTKIEVPLTLEAEGWHVEGQPDLHRVSSLGLVTDQRGPRPGRLLYLDDMVLIEPGGPVNSDTAPLNELIERLAKRQWDGAVVRTQSHPPVDPQ